jgi:hypothetical protein
MGGETMNQNILLTTMGTTWGVVPDIRLLVLPCRGVHDLSSAEECNRMAELIFRAALHGSRCANTLLISLAGGRKTMSADMQRSAHRDHHPTGCGL